MKTRNFLRILAAVLLVALAVTASLRVYYAQPAQVPPPSAERIEVIAPDGRPGTLPMSHWPLAQTDGYRLAPTAPATTTAPAPQLLPQEAPACDEACLRRMEEEHKKLR